MVSIEKVFIAGVTAFFAGILISSLTVIVFLKAPFFIEIITKNSGKLITISELATFLFGIPVSLIGSITTAYLAFRTVKISSEVSDIEKRREERDLIEKCNTQAKVEYQKILIIKNNIFEIKQVSYQIILEVIDNISVYYDIKVKANNNDTPLIRKFLDENGNLEQENGCGIVILLAQRLVDLISLMLENINTAINYNKTNESETKLLGKKINTAAKIVSDNFGLFNENQDIDLSWLLLAGKIKNSTNIINIIRAVDLLISSSLFNGNIFINESEIDPYADGARDNLVWNSVKTQKIGYVTFNKSKEEWIGSLILLMMNKKYYKNLSKSEKEKVSKKIANEMREADDYSYRENHEEQEIDETSPYETQLNDNKKEYEYNKTFERKIRAIYDFYKVSEERIDYEYNEWISAGKYLIDEIEIILPNIEDIYHKLLENNSVQLGNTKVIPKTTDDDKKSNNGKMIVLKPKFYIKVYN